MHSNARGLVISCISVTQFNNGLSNQLTAILAVNGRKVISVAICSMFLVLIASAAHAQFPVRNLNPFALYVGLPELKSADKLTAGEQEIELNTTISNHFIVETDESDPLYLDGETTVADFVWRQGFEKFELEVTVPYVKHEEGSLDGFIINFHEAFGFPGGDRDTVENNQLFFSYLEEQDKEHVQLTERVEGIGDVRLNIGQQITRQADYQHAVHLLLKLPTGESEDWLGSGSADISAYTTHSWQLDDWIANAQFGMVLMETPEILEDKRRKTALFGNVALSYVVMEGWHLTAQLDMHSPLYKGSELNQLGDGYAATLGSEWFGKHWAMHMAVVEDIKIDSVPDVGFQLGLKWMH